MKPVPVYALEPFPSEVTRTIFLAGPTPRSPTGKSWRDEALELLEKLGFDGHVFIPEPRNGGWARHYDEQVEWEEEGLHRADAIVFWVPRDMSGDTYGCPMPGLTTNDEWGAWKASGKVVWGSPEWATSVRYQRFYAEKLGVRLASSLTGTLAYAMVVTGEGAKRVDGECCVPVHVWRKSEFQDWYCKMVAAGNRLDGARVLWSFWPKPSFMFSYALHVDVHIGAEGRSKKNEFVFFRSDVSNVVMYSYDDWGMPSVVLVKEFRSPARNNAAYVYELPGGSSAKEGEDPLSIASHEVEEETGLKLDPSRFREVQARQLAATLSAHKASLYAVELAPAEMQQLAEDKSVHGVEEETERTYVEVVEVPKLLSDGLVDWTTLGMILSVVFAER